MNKPINRILSQFPFVVFFGVLAILLLVIDNAFIIHIFIMIFTSSTLALAWNLIGGFGGQFSLGHAAFYGIGAYTSTLLFIHFGISPWIGMIIGGLVAGTASLLIGFPCFQLRGTYFCLSTIAFGEVLRILVIYFKSITEGGVGISLKFQPSFFNFMFKAKEPYAFISLGIMLIVVIASAAIERSRLGYYLIAIKENEDSAKALGINTFNCKMVAFFLSAFFTALVGSFFAQYILFIDPESEFSMGLSMFITLPVMIGGIGTTVGPIIGSFMIAPLQEILSMFIGGQYQGLQNIIFGTTLVLVVIFIPQGAFKWFQGLFKKDFAKE
jgi:branched-chain amino acid transport system permease protein